MNILLSVPLGYLMPMLWRKLDRWWKVVLFGFAASVCIEALQLITRRTYADIDDLINNTIWAGIGYVLYKLNIKSHS